MKYRYLYKAKRVDNGKWVSGFLIFCEERHFICNKPECDTNKYMLEGHWFGTFFEIDPSTICQCTGLKDESGNLIWENDIVRCIDKINDIEFTACVKFGNPNEEYNWGWQLHHLSGDKPNLDILLWVGMEESGAFCEVVGNVFDNTELLEVK